MRTCVLIAALATGALATGAQDLGAQGLGGQASDSLEGRSLLGKPLYRATLSAEVSARYNDRLAAAKSELALRPDDPDALIWVGRRTAYLGRYRESREIFTEGVKRYPRDARFLRHRGHRYLSVRLIDSAITDFSKAWTLTRGQKDEIEPDGMPNASNIPTSTLQSNICYHLGLAWYLRGAFARALPVYEQCERVSSNADMLVATRYWHYMTLRRMGRATAARRLLADITPSMEVIENGAYHRLLLLNKGMLPLDSLVATGGAGVSALDATVTDASLWYGIGNWHLYNGRRREANRIFQRIVAGPAWSAFGYIAAEAELARANARR